MVKTMSSEKRAALDRLEKKVDILHEETRRYLARRDADPGDSGDQEEAHTVPVEQMVDDEIAPGPLYDSYVQPNDEMKERLGQEWLTLANDKRSVHIDDLGLHIAQRHNPHYQKRNERQSTTR